MTLKLKIERIDKKGKKHVSHLKENDVFMHVDIIEKLINKAIKANVKAELIEVILNNGYTRED
jgi:hypothetical protein